MVVATEDNTTVDVHYSNVPLPNENFTLNQYEVFTGLIEGDFTGTRVVSNKPVSVYSGGDVIFHAPVNNIGTNRDDKRQIYLSRKA